MQHKSSLREFLDKSWPEVSSRIGSEAIFEDVAPLMQDLLLSTDDKEQLIDAIQIFFMTLTAEAGIFCATKDFINETDQLFRSQAVLYKPNNEKILIYVSTGSLDKATEKLFQRLHLLGDSSKTKGWKFGIVTNMKQWAIFGVDTSKIYHADWKTLCETHDLESFMSNESLKPFLKDMMTILYFDLPEVVFEED